MHLGRGYVSREGRPVTVMHRENIECVTCGYPTCVMHILVTLLFVLFYFIFCRGVTFSVGFMQRGWWLLLFGVCGEEEAVEIIKTGICFKKKRRRRNQIWIL